MSTGRPSLWYVTPAHGRLPLSKIVFSQRAAVCKAMAAYGIDASCCVVACDGNLDLARRHGFATVEYDNAYLGRRWNEGYAFAAEEGVDYIVPIGSDSLLAPDFFAAGLPGSPVVLTSSYYAAVDEQGAQLARLAVTAPPGVGPHVVPVALLRDCGYQPVDPYIQRGCDGSLMHVVMHQPGARLEWRDLHPWQYLRLSTAGEQLNTYQALAARYATEQHSGDIWPVLRTAYPAALVRRIQALYVARLQGAAQ